MELRPFAQCAYRMAARSSTTPLIHAARHCQTRPGLPFPLIPSSTRLISNTTSNQAPPRSAPTHGSPAHRTPTSTPPRPPPARSPWASRESGATTSPRAGSAASSAPPKSGTGLPSLIKWDVDAFLLRNHMSSGPPEKMRLRPSTGRTVYRSGNVDVARSFQVLNRLVKVNRVRQDFQRQRFHERGGLKRKRQRSERWRRRFQHGFRAVVQRVVELRNQGW